LKKWNREKSLRESTKKAEKNCPFSTRESTSGGTPGTRWTLVYGRKGRESEEEDVQEGSILGSSGQVQGSVK